MTNEIAAVEILVGSLDMCFFITDELPEGPHVVNKVMLKCMC